MQEFEYRLEKEDYKNWIHWNVLKHESKKMKMVSALLYVAFLALFLGKNVMQAKGNLVLLVPSIVIAVLVGIGMFYMISNQNQERMIWKRSGLKNLEKTGNFPVVHLTLDEKTLTMTVAAQEMTKTYSYSDIEQMVEIERMYLLETNEKTWQFIAKSAFSSEEEQKQFETFMNEKLADAKEKPEEYLLVDGYNIIFAWPELRELAQINLDSARDKLMDILCNYQGYQGCRLILVYDAYKVKGNPGSVMKYHNIEVVYTKEAETADQYIERTTHELGAKPQKYRVTVATSDALEQMIIWGNGATRMSALGLKAAVESAGAEYFNS